MRRLVKAVRAWRTRRQVAKCCPEFAAVLQALAPKKAP